MITPNHHLFLMAVCPICGCDVGESGFCPECGSDISSVKKADDSSDAVLDVIGEYHAPASLPDVIEIRATGDVHIPVGFDGPLRTIRAAGDVYLSVDLDVRIITTGRIVFIDEGEGLRSPIIPPYFRSQLL